MMRLNRFMGLYSRTFSILTLLAVTLSFSMVSLAAAQPVGELIVRPVQTFGGAAVRVDGQEAASGRTVFASSVITTPAEFGASLNLGRNGTIEIAPSTVFVLSPQNGALIGELRSGTVSSFGKVPLSVRTANGSIVQLDPGQSVNADSSMPQTKKSGSFPEWGWAVLIGVVVGVVVIALAAGSGGNDNNTASPIS